MSIRECIEKGHLQQVPPDEALAEKEFREAIADLETSRKASKAKDYKWCIISAYYAMFHAARGLLFLNGLREKAHYAVKEALSELAENGKIGKDLPVDFAAAMHARENADYRYTYSKETAGHILEMAKDFVAALVTAKSQKKP